MPRWLPRALTRIRGLAAGGHVVLTDKALSELDALRIRPEDVVEILQSLSSGDYPARLWSERFEEWLYVFRPAVAGLRVYLKVAIRVDCVVISCHEDEAEAAEGPDRDE